jgi:hypothetical protein
VTDVGTTGVCGCNCGTCGCGSGDGGNENGSGSSLGTGGVRFASASCDGGHSGAPSGIGTRGGTVCGVGSAGAVTATGADGSASTGTGATGGATSIRGTAGGAAGVTEDTSASRSSWPAFGRHRQLLQPGLHARSRAPAAALERRLSCHSPRSISASSTHRRCIYAKLTSAAGPRRGVRDGTAS